ncbi:hypothetical protein XF_2351 [Xylella fastidiosa 9a5c]|uniref:Uncharacterized protein n=1 Tax=Xylella fastidiosa (strain 9a5c) TaxID=160492 RepID=Q9PAZ4_XYLFA|nr:hypothetical protein XF_2351 [Xylella fastidiosa 9a5c]
MIASIDVDRFLEIPTEASLIQIRGYLSNPIKMRRPLWSVAKIADRKFFSTHGVL